jgi:SAM-dependent methyltransferase
MFDRYSEFYDVIYRDKDYEAECDFLERVFETYAPPPVRTVLDLGCGTGSHAVPMARRGYRVTGVDRSELMLAEARRKAAEGGTPSGGAPELIRGDIQTLSLGQTFDAAVAMFAVMGYQTGEEELLSAFRAARRHLRRGGLFVFDGWWGEAVLDQKPSARAKVVERGGERVERLAEPVLDVPRRVVRVRYKIRRVKDGVVTDEVEEIHPVRFFFPEEIVYTLAATDFKLLRLCPFMSLGREMTRGDWNFSAIAEAL